MLAYEEARKAGADGIELDVQRTKDRALVIFHDDIMSRTARWRKDAGSYGTPGKAVEGHVYDYTLDEIAHMEVGSWKDEAFYGERVPTMREVFEWMQTNQMRVNIEVKVPPMSYQSFLTVDTLKMAQACGVTERLIVSSFYHPALADSKSVCPGVPVGILTSDYLDHPEGYARLLGAQAVHPWFGNIDAARVRACTEEGLEVNVWTPNSKEELKRSMDMGVTTLITNCPEEALKLLGREAV